MTKPKLDLKQTINPTQEVKSSMNCFTHEQLSRITNLVREIEKLNDVEKLFLYLQLPCGRAEGLEEFDTKTKFNGIPKSGTNLFSKKLDQETTQTYTWILSHLEIDPNVSLPKQEVYEEYKAFCQSNKFEPLCVADFGKAMKHAFPCVKPRRLGQRGNSRYCYSGLRKKYKIMAPSLPDMIEPTFCVENDCSQAYNQIVRECIENPAECPLNLRPNYSCPDVAKMKSDPTSQVNHIHSIGNVSSRCNNNGDLYNRSEPVQASSSTQDINRQRNKPNPLHNTDIAIHSTPMSSDEYMISDLVPTTQANVSRYNYMNIIHQPGTPDDDDYQHNYRDVPISQMNKNIINFPIITPGDNLYQHSVNNPSRSVIQITGVPSSTSNSVNLNVSNLAHSQFGLDTTSQLNTNTSNIFHLTHLGNSHTESCASPFQSPASTPYPMSNNYVNHDIQDYYPTNDNHRYNDQVRPSPLRETYQS